MGDIHPIPLPSLHGMEGSSLPGIAPPSYMVNSKCVVGVKPGDSAAVIGYHIDKFTHTWSAEHFIA